MHSSINNYSFKHFQTFVMFPIDKKAIFLSQKRYFFLNRKCICEKNISFVYYNHSIMENKELNRLKVVLAEKKRTNKWLAEQLGKDPATVSKWCTNSAQPNLENLIEIAKCLEVDVNELLRMDQHG